MLKKPLKCVSSHVVSLLFHKKTNTFYFVFHLRDPHPSEKRTAFQCLASKEARAREANWPGGDRDMGARGGAGPLGDQSLLRKVRRSRQSLECDELSARSTSKHVRLVFPFTGWRKKRPRQQSKQR